MEVSEFWSRPCSNTKLALLHGEFLLIPFFLVARDSLVPSGDRYYLSLPSPWSPKPFIALISPVLLKSLVFEPISSYDKPGLRASPSPKSLSLQPSLESSSSCGSSYYLSSVISCSPLLRLSKKLNLFCYLSDSCSESRGSSGYTLSLSI